MLRFIHGTLCSKVIIPIFSPLKSAPLLFPESFAQPIHTVLHPSVPPFAVLLLHPFPSIFLSLPPSPLSSPVPVHFLTSSTSFISPCFQSSDCLSPGRAVGGCAFNGLCALSDGPWARQPLLLLNGAGTLLLQLSNVGVFAQRGWISLLWLIFLHLLWNYNNGGPAERTQTRIVLLYYRSCSSANTLRKHNIFVNAWGTNKETDGLGSKTLVLTKSQSLGWMGSGKTPQGSNSMTCARVRERADKFIVD